ncbi:unnamed protein product [Diplocarpon coronariae]
MARATDETPLYTAQPSAPSREEAFAKQSKALPLPVPSLAIPWHRIASLTPCPPHSHTHNPFPFPFPFPSPLPSHSHHPFAATPHRNAPPGRWGFTPNRQFTERVRIRIRIRIPPSHPTDGRAPSSGPPRLTLGQPGRQQLSHAVWPKARSPPQPNLSTSSPRRRAGAGSRNAEPLQSRARRLASDRDPKSLATTHQERQTIPWLKKRR